MDIGKSSHWHIICKGTGGNMGRDGGQTGGYRETVILLGTYNIRNGRNGGLDSVMRVMSQYNLDLGFFQQKKVPDRIHTCVSAGYRILSVDTPKCHRRGVAVFYWYAPHFQVEVFQLHGPNMSIF